MKAYKVTTTFLGADGASDFYFSTKAQAELELRYLSNGKYEVVEIAGLSELPKEGCTWSDIDYWSDCDAEEL